MTGTPGHPEAGAEAGRIPAILAWTAWATLMLSALARVVAAVEPFPHWGVDATVMAAPFAALGPSATMALDLASVLACAAVLLAEWVAGRRVLGWALGLLAIGAVPVARHSFDGALVALDNARIGLAWLGAGAAAVAMLHLCRAAVFRRVTLAAAAGVFGMLAAKGLYQVFLEHPATLRNYEANREMILGAYGWSPDSASARGFDRRLRQAEATGWFGLANVYASFAAATFVALLGMAVLAWRSARSAAQEVPDGIAALVTAGGLLSGAGVVMAGSKAGYAVAALGVVMLAIGWLGARERPGWLRLRGPIPGGPLALAVIGAMLAAVVVRGGIGTAIGESSILFRWFYLQGASSVLLENWLWGVGPAGFKDAYMMAKPPLAPESVDSPHSILFDYVTRLGLGGAAFAVLFLVLAWGCGVQLLRPAPGDSALSIPARGEAWCVIGVLVLPALLSGWLESGQTTIETALARLIGLVVSVGVALALLWVMRSVRAWPACFAAGGIALAAHAQIEMTPTQPASAPLFMVLLAAAAAGADAGRAAGSRLRRGLAFGAPAVLTLGALAGAVLIWPPALEWERRLHRAAEVVRPVAEFRARLSALATTGPAGADSIDAIARDLGAMLARPAPRSEAEFQGALNHLTTDLIEGAIPVLRAAAHLVRHDQTLEALSRLHLGLASVLADAGDQAGTAREGERAEHVASDSASLNRGRASAWGWLGTVCSTRSRLERDPAHLERAVAAWKLAADLDPHGMTFPLQVFRALVALDRPAEAREWGERVLAADERLRLDPLLRLTDNDRAAVERVVRGGTP